MFWLNGGLVKFLVQQLKWPNSPLLIKLGPSWPMVKQAQNFTPTTKFLHLYQNPYFETFFSNLTYLIIWSRLIQAHILENWIPFKMTAHGPKSNLERARYHENNIYTPMNYLFIYLIWKQKEMKIFTILLWSYVAWNIFNMPIIWVMFCDLFSYQQNQLNC